MSRARPVRSWTIWLTVLGGCGAAVLGVHLATSSQNLDAVSTANIFRAVSNGSGHQAHHQGYGRGGDTMMPHTSEATQATSMNWSGYADAGQAGTFTSVASAWTQPAVTCGAAATFSSFW